MIVNDPIADMLTRIRNAQIARHDATVMPASNTKKAIAKILLEEGYIKAYDVIDDGLQGQIKVTLKYVNGKSTPVIAGLKLGDPARSLGRLVGIQREMVEVHQHAGKVLRRLAGVEIRNHLVASLAVDDLRDARARVRELPARRHLCPAVTCQHEIYVAHHSNPPIEGSKSTFM